MGTPHVIDEQPGDLVPSEELEAQDKLFRRIKTAQRLAGPIPEQPAYLVERGYGPTNVDAKTGFLIVGSDPGIYGDPTAALYSADYQARLAAWNQRFTSFFDALGGKV